MKIIKSVFVQGSVLLLAIGMLASCAASGRVKVGQTSEQVEKLQNNTEYSAIESEWNELYQ